MSISSPSFCLSKYIRFFWAFPALISHQDADLCFLLVCLKLPLSDPKFSKRLVLANFPNSLAVNLCWWRNRNLMSIANCCGSRKHNICARLNIFVIFSFSIMPNSHRDGRIDDNSIRQDTRVNAVRIPLPASFSQSHCRHSFSRAFDLSLLCTEEFPTNWLK